jgi:hypothetical protein
MKRMLLVEKCADVRALIMAGLATTGTKVQVILATTMEDARTAFTADAEISIVAISADIGSSPYRVASFIDSLKRTRQSITVIGISPNVNHILISHGGATIGASAHDCHFTVQRLL